MLFQTKEPLHIRANTKIKYIKKNLNDPTYSAREIYYEKGPGLWDSVEVGVRLHGHFRLENCHFPPTKLKLKKDYIEGFYAILKDDAHFKESILEGCRTK